MVFSCITWIQFDLLCEKCETVWETVTQSMSMPLQAQAIHMYMFSINIGILLKTKFETPGKEQLRDPCIYMQIYLGKPQRFSFPCRIAPGVHRVLHKIQRAAFAAKSVRDPVDTLMVFKMQPRQRCKRSEVHHSGRKQRDKHHEMSTRIQGLGWITHKRNNPIYYYDICHSPFPLAG